MSDPKKPSGASRSSKKKPRKSTDEPVESAHDRDLPEEDRNESEAYLAPPSGEDRDDRDEQAYSERRGEPAEMDNLDGEPYGDEDDDEIIAPVPAQSAGPRGEDRDRDRDRDRGNPERHRGGDRNRDRDRNRGDRGDRDHRREGGGPRTKPADEFLTQVYFDKSNRQFVATVLEFPELKATGPNKEGTLRSLDNKIESHVQNLRRRNEPVPEGVGSKRYPERLEVKVSQQLFRRLDVLSRTEKVPLDQLAGELISAGLESKRAEKRPEPQQNRGGNRDRERHNAPPGNSRHQQPRHGRRNNYHETMDSRENFMEYVRNLEKGNWKKR